MTATAALCAPNNVFYQRVLALARPSLPSALLRTNSTVICSTPSSAITFRSIESTPNDFKIESDENNNDRSVNNATIDVLYITSDDDVDDDDDDIIENEEDVVVECTNQNISPPIDANIDQDHFLSLIGLRAKNKKIDKTAPKLGPLTKRWANPICLLPLAKNYVRVRQALYSLMPFLKFLKITHDVEQFCATDDTAKARSLLPRSSMKSRVSTTTNKKRAKKSKSITTALIKSSGETRLNDSERNCTDDYLHSIIECHVSLDRLEQSTIDEIIRNSMQNSNENVEILSTCEETPLRVKRKATLDERIPSKRLKTRNQHQPVIDDEDSLPDFSSSMYKRIYLKCFVCSKRKFIDAQVIDSNVLHSHWLEHGDNLTINIYDSEIDSILTRVVEFFHSPKRHTLEGKLKTVFLLNSYEIKHLPENESLSSDNFVIVD